MKRSERGERKKTFSQQLKQLKLTIRSHFGAMRVDWNSEAALPKHIITTDVPDPDNFLMVLRVLKDNGNRQVDIIVSPRPVSFAAVPYRQHFGALSGKVKDALKNEPCAAQANPQLRKMITPVTDDDVCWTSKLQPKDQEWFYVDEGLHDPEVIEDTKLYMEVSRLRFISYLDQHHVDRRQCNFYTDKELRLSKTIRPGLRHAAHKPDFVFDFDKDLREEYEDAAMAAAEACDGLAHCHSDELRRKTRELCRQYIQRKTAALQLSERESYGDLTDLISKHRSLQLRPDLYIGGPFTEGLAIVRQLPVGRVVAMGGFIDGSTNLLNNQFNLFIDMDSARQMLGMAAAGQLDLTLLPTECVKGAAYELTRAEFDAEIAPWSPATRALYDCWQPDTRPVAMFDLLAVMSVSRPDLFDVVRAVRLVDDGTVLKFVPDTSRQDARGPGIKMIWNEPTPSGTNEDGTPHYVFDRNQYMLGKKKEFIQEVRRMFI